LAGTAVLGRTILGCEKAPASTNTPVREKATVTGRDINMLKAETWEKYGFYIASVNFQAASEELEIIIDTDRVNAIKLKGHEKIGEEAPKNYLSYRQDQETQDTKRFYFAFNTMEIIQFEGPYTGITFIVSYADGHEKEIFWGSLKRDGRIIVE
jgi:hypothetical protein